eukprot:gene13498-23633_t
MYVCDSKGTGGARGPAAAADAWLRARFPPDGVPGVSVHP